MVVDAAELPLASLDPLIDRALAEDVGAGDVTTSACVEPAIRARADAVARHPMVVCGGAVFARVYQRFDPSLDVEVVLADGTLAAANAVLWRVSGSARSVLSGERVALNFVQRMSGIATLTRRYVDALHPGSKTRITDTRKTTPGLRLLERYAVRTGGAHNHRDNLSSAVMIKDNHIAACGSIALAVGRARSAAPHTTRIEVEVTSLDELEQALAAGADVVLLDNMDTEHVVLALERVAKHRPGRPLIEVSGGITLERIRELSALGVDVISSGALTHSPAAADIGLDFAFVDRAHGS
jgi:nicotinate-nucleotide pyrophosphorylase (carboxylating)